MDFRKMISTKKDREQFIFGALLGLGIIAWLEDEFKKMGNIRIACKQLEQIPGFQAWLEKENLQKQMKKKSSAKLIRIK